jgi:hypothetical protein
LNRRSIYVEWRGGGPRSEWIFGLVIGDFGVIRFTAFLRVPC